MNSKNIILFGISLAACVSTVMAQPGMQAQLNASNISTTSATLNIARGNGDRTLLVGKVGSSLPEIPVNNILYCNHSSAAQGAYEFGTGDQVGPGAFAIATMTTGGNCGCNMASVTTIIVYNLLPGTTYTIRAFESAGSGCGSALYNFTTGPNNPITFTTIPSNPVTAAVTTIGQNSFSAKWAATTGATGYYLDVSTSNTFSSFVGANNNLNVGNVTEFAVSGLSAGTTYYYRVRAFSSGGTSGNSDTRSVLTAPPDPTALAATSVTQTSFAANWNSSLAATSYRLDVSSTDFVTFVSGYENKTVSATSDNVTGLSAGITYKYRVRAVNASGTSASSGAISQVTISATPVATTASAITQTGFVANWGASTGATGYHLDVSLDNFQTFVTGYNNKSIATTSETVSGLAAGTTYSYRLRSSNTAGTSSNSNTISLITIPSAPTTTTSNVSATSFQINWNAVVGATSYRVDVSENNSFSSFVTGYNNQTANSSNISVTGLTPNTIYYYRVRSVNSGGTSPNSATQNQLTLTMPPVASSMNAISHTGFQASWSSVSGATHYKIDLATDVNFTSKVVGYDDLTVSATTLDFAGLSGGTTYYFRVRAVNASGPSANSNTISALTIPSPPIATNPTLITISGFTANWNASQGASEYRLEVYTGNFDYVSGYNNLLVAQTSAAVTGLSEGVVYQYRVRAVNASGTSDYSQTISVVTVPPIPVASSATSISTTSFTANWSSVSGASEYLLDVSSDEFSTFLAGHNGKVVSSTSAVISGLQSNTSYKYRVRATSTSGTSGNSNIVSVLTQPDAPLNPSAISIGQNNFTAGWSVVTGITEYLLDVSTDDFATNLTNYSNRSVVGNTISVINLTPGTPYKFRVRAKNATGPSANSSVVSLITVPANPVALPASSITQGSFTANWNSVVSADNYLLDVSLSSAFSPLLGEYNSKVIPSVSTSHSITGLQAGTIYYYRIRAANISGNSENSNHITQITVPAKPVMNTAQQITSNSFLASWAEVAGADAYELDVFSEVDGYVNPITGYNAKLITGLTEDFVRNLSPSTQYKFRARSKNSAGVSDNAIFKAALTLSSTGTVSNPPEISPGTATSSTSVKAIISGGIPPYTVTFFHKKITAVEYTAENALQSLSTNIDFGLSDSYLDELGMEYYFTVVDDGGREKTSAVAKKIISFENSSSQKFISGIFNGTRASMQVISIPFELNNTSIENIFGSLGVYDKKSWRLAHYRNGRNIEYQTPGFPEMTRGLGYWFNSKVDASTLTTGAGTAGANDQANPFKMELAAGWNQIGNPYPFNIDWSDVLADNPNVSGVGGLKVYDGSIQNFKNTDDLKKFEGGFVFADNPVTLNLKVGLRNTFTAGRKKENEISSDLNGDNWQVPLILQQGNSLWELSGFGMHRSASASKDSYDDMRLPRLDEFLDATFKHPEYKSPNFSRDIVPTEEHHEWTFSIESSDQLSDINLAWDNTTFGDNTANLYLLDKTDAAWINMRRESSVSFKGGQREFKLFYSKRGDVLSPGIFLLSKPYPNPSTGEVKINLVLPDSQSSYHVEVYILDNLGRLIRTSMNEKMNGGAHRLRWDGLNAEGTACKSGVYFIRMKINGTELKESVRRVIIIN